MLSIRAIIRDPDILAGVLTIIICVFIMFWSYVELVKNENNTIQKV